MGLVIRSTREITAGSNVLQTTCCGTPGCWHSSFSGPIAALFRVTWVAAGRYSSSPRRIPRNRSPSD